MRIKPNKYVALNEASLPRFSFIHPPNLTGIRGGVTLIYSDNEGVHKNLCINSCQVKSSKTK